MGRRVSRIASSSHSPSSSPSSAAAWDLLPGEAGEVAEPPDRALLTILAFVQALRRAVKHRNPSLYVISSFNLFCWRSFLRSVLRRSASPTPSGESKRKGLIFFFFATGFLVFLLLLPLVEFVLVCARPVSLSSLLESSLSQSARSIHVVGGSAGSAGGRGASEGSSEAAETELGKAKSLRIFEARMLRTASFCLRRSLLVRSAS